MAAPIYNVSPQMGANLIIVVFAVVVIAAGLDPRRDRDRLRLGLIEDLTKVFFPEASNTVDLRGHGRGASDPAGRAVRTERIRMGGSRTRGSAGHTDAGLERAGRVCDGAAAAVLPAFVYPVFLMKACALPCLPAPSICGEASSPAENSACPK